MSERTESEWALVERVLKRAAVPPRKGATPSPQKAGSPAASGTWKLPGILSDTRITTNFGEVPAHLVRTRDRLKVRDGRYLPVLRIPSLKLDE